MTKATLYGNAHSFRTQKVLVAAKFAKKELDVKEHLPHEKFPLGLTPAFEDGQLQLFGADAIALHVAASNQTYVPKDPALHQWLSWADAELLPNVLAYVLPSISFVHVDNAAIEQAREELTAQLKHFDKWLLSRTYLVGERLSAADVSVALNLMAAFQHVFDKKVREQLVNVTRWFTTVINQKLVKEVVGDVKLAEQVSTFHADTYKKNSSGKKEEAKHEKKHDEKKHDKKHDKKAEKSAEKPAEKSAEKPKPAPKQQEEPEDDTPVEPKFVDPFAEMPGGKFSMDGFKRVYSNEDTVTKAIPYFWEHFEPENYSIWYGEYKYPEDLQLVFMSCNLITGMFQRLDKMRKHAFGSVCLFGKDGDSTISGIWIWRGQQLAFELSPDWQVDYESYEWKKLDPATDETKKLVNTYLTWEGIENPKPFNQGKIFK